MFTTTKRSNGIEASLVLSDGTIAGTGYASEDEEYACHFACLDAVNNGHPQAACGHARYLTARDEKVVRKEAAKLGYR